MSTVEPDERDETASPIRTNQEGHYLVAEPLDGKPPEQMSLTYDGVTFHLEGYLGTVKRSRVLPNVLSYKDMWVEHQ